MNVGKEWRSRLRALGFEPRGTGGRKGTYTSRGAGPVRQAVGVLIDESRNGAFNVQLNVNMALPHTEPPYDVVILLADLADDGVRIQEPWVHDPKLNTWWGEARVEQAWSSFVEHGLSWLDRHSDPSHLIEYFETEYARLENDRLNPPRAPLMVRMGRRLGILPEPTPTAHHQYLLWLSMLYEAQGELELAMQRLELYREEIISRNIRKEIDRLALHRERLRSRRK